MNTFRINIAYLLSLIVILCLSWYIQNELLLNWDVSLLLNITKQTLAGGTYSNDFFTPNPPMILYLYMPTVLISKLFSINIIIIFRIYIFFLALCSFFLSSHLAKKIFQDKNQLLFHLFLVTMLAVFLILPSYQFGQRDHLLAIFSMPYLLLVTLRLQGQSINNYFAIGIGLFAALGFGIKPQFLCAPMLIELYYCYRQKSIVAWMRPETISILLLLLIYTISVFQLFPDYIHIIIPYMLQNYYTSISTPWIDLMLNKTALFCVFAIAFYLTQLEDNAQKTLITILCIACIGYLISYLSQHTPFFYHLIPAFSIAILLFVLVFGSLMHHYKHVFTYTLGLFIFLFPTYLTYTNYIFAIDNKNTVVRNLITFMQTQPPHQSIYVFSEANYACPLINYMDATFNQRFDCMWMIGDLIKQRSMQGDAKIREYIKNNKDKYFFLNIISGDLRRHKPDLVFVDINRINTGLNGFYSHFDYLSYFLENETFRNEWKSYQYLATIGGGSIKYKLQVYKRTT